MANLSSLESASSLYKVSVLSITPLRDRQHRVFNCTGLLSRLCRVETEQGGSLWGFRLH